MPAGRVVDWLRKLIRWGIGNTRSLGGGGREVSGSEVGGGLRCRVCGVVGEKRKLGRKGRDEGKWDGRERGGMGGRGREGKGMMEGSGRWEMEEVRGVYLIGVAGCRSSPFRRPRTVSFVGSGRAAGETMTGPTWQW